MAGVIYIRGMIGIVLLIAGIVLYVFEKTKPIAPIVVGFGLGLISQGFRD